eukprot:IDg14732t1
MKFRAHTSRRVSASHRVVMTIGVTGICSARNQTTNRFTSVLMSGKVEEHLFSFAAENQPGNQNVGSTFMALSSNTAHDEV